VVGELQKLHAPPRRSLTPTPSSPANLGPRCLLQTMSTHSGANTTPPQCIHHQDLEALSPAGLAQWALRHEKPPECIASIAGLAMRKGYEALIALVDQGYGASLPNLAAILRGLGSPWAPSNCLDEIRRCLNQDSFEALEALTEAIGTGRVCINEAMVEQILGTLPKATGDDSQARVFRQTAYSLLASDRYPAHVVNASHVGTLCEQLSADPLDWGDATAIARVLAQWRHPDAAPALVNLVLRNKMGDAPSDAEMQARWGAAEALEKLWLTDSDRAKYRQMLERNALQGRAETRAPCIQAVASLGRPSEPFSRQLVKRFKRAPYLGPGILIALARSGSTDALPLILSATKSRVLAKKATVALAEIMPNSSEQESQMRTELSRLAANHSDPHVRLAAIRAVENHRGWMGSEAAALCQERLQRDSNHSVRLACIHALRQMEATGASKVLLSVALEDPDPRVQTLAMGTIAQLPIDSKEKLSIGSEVVSILQSHDAGDFPFAAMFRLLTSWGTPGAFDAILNLALRHGRADVRAAAIRGASQLPVDEAQLKELTLHLPAWSQDDHPEIRLAAAFAAGSIGGFDSLQLLLSDPDPQVRIAVLEGASGHRALLESRSGLQCAASAVTDPVPAVRVAAIHALSQVKSPEAIEWMAHGLQDPYLARPLAEGLGRHGHPAGLDLLLGLFGGSPTGVGVQAAVIRSIGHLDLQGAPHRAGQDLAIALLSRTLLKAEYRVLRSAAAYQFVKMRAWNLSTEQKMKLADTLRKALAGETDQSVRRHLPVALGSLQLVATLPALETLAHSQQPSVRTAAARGLGYHKHEPRVKTLLSQMMKSDPSAFVRQTINKLIGNGGYELAVD
jgi:HEAT repeat protein